MGLDRRFRAHPQSAPGDFYVVNDECISCGAPHAVAPDLIGWAEVPEGNHDHCIWKKQPTTPDEFEQAVAAFDASEVGCYRYAGADPAIMSRIGLDYCDHPEFAETRQGDRDRSGSVAPPREIQFTLLESRESDAPFRWSALNRVLKSIGRYLHR
jgi:hypothetical protein